MKDHKLWASQNRSPLERRKCKLVSKMKRMLIEHVGYEPESVIVSYKWFQVLARGQKRFHNVATLLADGSIQWAESDGIVSEEMNAGMAEFEASLE